MRASIETEADPALKAQKQRLERLLTLRFDPSPEARILAIQGFGADTGLDLRAALSPLVATTLKVGASPEGNVARTLRPGGIALLTFHDEGYAGAWGPPGVVGRLEREPFIVLNDAMEGSNYLSSWTTAEHLKALAGPLFEVLEIVPGRADNPTQAVAVLRARRS